MAKLYTRLQNEKGKIVGVAANEYIDIDITVGNNILARFTLRGNEHGSFSVYDKDDNEVGRTSVDYECERGHGTVSWSMQDMLDRGTPVCVDCGHDMEIIKK